ncbi:MAG: tRNA (adenosine(37)-N6)-threonylcarbamoyltransferase complex dimerization subunit type 1 TsaB [Xanthomonadales bacterium]|jgi:tRNA threonylcarbamoyladenosine biosynthesis protein TsaB|nr:tRNA (adenosine(37)-N6)-threonylcarbamoyltransferase complex dimerization subunit type 1 TsaB [Xanthomonadales bacterium]
MKLLAIESAFEACSVALWQDGACLERVHTEPRGHATVLLPTIEALLGEGGVTLVDLDGIAFSRGPGSFTSLRIGIGVVQGLAYGADIPVWPVSSLRLVAQGAVTPVDGVSGSPVERAWVAMDARMGEVYTGCYRLEGAIMKAFGPERVCPPEDAAPKAPDRWTPLGSGFERFDVLRGLAGGRGRSAWPRAAVLASLAAAEWSADRALSAELAQPVYLRNQVAEKPASTAG